MEELKNKFWAIGGGKGGVGKSIVTLMLGSCLSRQGKKVILVDADLGGSNLHTLVGIRYPLYTLADFINRKVETIEEVIMNTQIQNMKLICGADDILGMANPKSMQKHRLLNHLKRLEADYILLDLGAGTAFSSIDFFLYAPNKIVVLTPQITSIQNAYGFIKTSLYRKLQQTFRREERCLELIREASSPNDGNAIDSVETLKDAFLDLGEEYASKLKEVIDELDIKVIVNMVRGSKEMEVGNILKTVARNYLSLDLEDLGVVQYDKLLGMSINNMADFLAQRKDSIASSCFYDISRNIIRSCHCPNKLKPVMESQAPAEDPAPADNQVTGEDKARASADDRVTGEDKASAPEQTPDAVASGSSTE